MNINGKNVTIIGIAGRKRSGKNSVGKYLSEGRGYTELAFADALKNACKNIFGFTDDQLYGDELKEKIDNYWQHSPRELLQVVGTTLFRNELPKHCNNITNDLWVNVVKKKIIDLVTEKGITKFVITDVRFINEYNFIKNWGGQVFKVIRPNNIEHNNSLHESETTMDNIICDKTILNDGTLEDLYKNIEKNLIYEI